MIVDITKLMSVETFRKEWEKNMKTPLTRQGVYEKIKSGSIQSIRIDGRIFIYNAKFPG